MDKTTLNKDIDAVSPIPANYVAPVGDQMVPVEHFFIVAVVAAIVSVATYALVATEDPVASLIRWGVVIVAGILAVWFAVLGVQYQRHPTRIVDAPFYQGLLRVEKGLLFVLMVIGLAFMLAWLIIQVFGLGKKDERR